MLEDFTLGPQFNLEDPDWHYIYVCTKVIQNFFSTGSINPSTSNLLIEKYILVGLDFSIQGSRGEKKWANKTLDSLAAREKMKKYLN
jgi:hypothetical protein